MSRKLSHPSRESKIQDWINKLPTGTEFFARDVAKDLNLMPQEAGNYLKFQDTCRISRYIFGVGAVWVRLE